jgi:hypothetical protein
VSASRLLTHSHVYRPLLPTHKKIEHSLATLLVRVIVLLEIKLFFLGWGENLIRVHVERLPLRASAQITHTRICAGHFDLAALVSIIIFRIIGPGDEAGSRHCPVKISDALEILDVNLGDSVDETKVEIQNVCASAQRGCREVTHRPRIETGIDPRTEVVNPSISILSCVREVVNPVNLDPSSVCRVVVDP